jgi:hypothetical protein
MALQVMKKSLLGKTKEALLLCILIFMDVFVAHRTAQQSPRMRELKVEDALLYLDQVGDPKVNTGIQH